MMAGAGRRVVALLLRGGHGTRCVGRADTGARATVQYRVAQKQFDGYKKWMNPLPDLEPLKWSPKEVEAVAKVGSREWAPPTGETPDDLPFKVTRTGKGQQIPVYTDFKNGRTRVLTLVRKVTGDKKALCDELHKVCDGATVSMKQGRIEIEGNYCLPVTAYLAGLGF